MDFMVFVYLALAVGTLLISVRLFHDIYSPVAIMGFVWFTLLALYDMRLYPYHPLKWSTTLDFVTAITMYFLGCSIGRLLVAAGGGEARAAGIDVAEGVDSVRLRKVIIWLWVIGTLGFLGLFLRIVTLYGVAAFLSAPQLVHDNFSVRFLGYPWLANLFIPVLSFLYFKKVGKSGLIIGAGVTSLLWLSISVSRTNIIQAMFMAIVAASFLGLTRHDIRNLFITGIAAVVFFSLFAFLKDTSHAERLLHDQFRPKELRLFSSAYGYFTAPIATYEAMKADQQGLEYGINTFVTGVKVLNLVGFNLPIPKKPQKSYRTPVRCNVYTFIDVYYKDFGYYGIVILSFIQGLLVMVFYSRMKESGCYHLFLVNSVLAWCIFTTFFANHFKDNAFIFECVVGYFIGKYVVRKGGGVAIAHENVQDSPRGAELPTNRVMGAV